MSGGVLVVGSGGGIGAAVIRELNRRDVPNIGIDRETIDITQPGGAEEAVSFATSSLHGLSGIVHAIGMSGRRLGDGPITDCSDEAWHEVHRVNLESVFRLLRVAVPTLAAGGGGSIVVLGSALSRTLDADFLTVAYATAKGALLPLIRSSAYVGAPSGVRVNLVSPGVVDTPMARRAVESPEVAPRLAQLQALSRGAQSASSVAGVICWALSDDARDVTGAEIPADGGWTLR